MPEKVRVIVKRPKGSGRRVGWNKVVRRVDVDKAGGYSLEGELLTERQVDLEIGTVLVGQIPVGSARAGNHWRVGIVTSEGVEWESRTWALDKFLDFRDHVETLLRGDGGGIDALQGERARLLERVQGLDDLIKRAGQQ